jgi:hypothetical protein
MKQAKSLRMEQQFDYYFIYLLSIYEYNVKPCDIHLNVVMIYVTALVW